MDEILIELVNAVNQAREAGRREAFEEITHLVKIGVLSVDKEKLNSQSATLIGAMNAISAGLGKDQGSNHSNPSQQSGFKKF